MKQRRSRLRTALLVLPLGLCLHATGQDSGAALAAQAPTRTLKLEDYKYFRALSIDLQGRIPTRQELADFEKPDFNVDAWIDAHLSESTYVDRLTQIYSDLLRPAINGFRLNTFNRAGLSMVTFRGSDGKLTRLYFRPSQVRARIISERARLNADANYKSCAAIKDPVRDPLYVTLGCAKYETYDNLLKANMCVTADELGIRYNGSSTSAPTPFPAQDGDVPGTTPRANATQAALDKYTTLVKPWWLYADSNSPNPTDRYDPVTWPQRFPGFQPVSTLLKEPDNTTDVMQVRVCNEELQTATTGTVDGKTPAVTVSCFSGAGAAQSSACGCGPGLAWCLPAGTYNTTFPGGAFVSSRNVLLGVDDPTDQVNFNANDWMSLWMSQEPVYFLNRLFGEDRDFREIVTGKWTVVNGPLAQFYRLAARTPTLDVDLGQTPLPGDAALPKDLSPMDIRPDAWVPVEDRGPNAAGVLSQPWFNMKNATRRARGHVVYNAFVCRDFVAPPGLQLSAAPEPDLTKRSGCAVCHHTLEPLSAYFARTVESDWTWLDSKTYPTQNATCKKASAAGTIPSSCTTRYDNIFSSTDAGMLRGAYAAPQNTDAGPAGLGAYLTSQPEFSTCAVDNVAQGFLGRDLRAEDAALKQQLAADFVKSGYRMKALVASLLRSTAYRNANNWSPTIWRGEGK